jgi:hypothetical protein
MRKIIKRYICLVAILSTMVGYGQIDQNITTFKISPVTNNTVTITVTVINTVTNTVSFLKAMPLVLYSPPPIAAPTINIQEVLNNPSSSQEDKAKAAEALAIQKIQEGQAEAARAQMVTLLAWLEAQSQAQAQAQSQAQAQAGAEAFLTTLQQVSQSIANGGLLNTTTNPSLPIWYMDHDGDGYHSSTQQKATPPGVLWRFSTKGEDCNDNDAAIHSCSSTIIPWFLDNDFDGYHAAVQPGTSKPTTQGNWTSVMTKGPDCNDGVFSADNSACSAPCTITITCPTGQTLNVAICACENCNTIETAKAEKVTKLANITEAKTKILQLQSDAKTKADETNFSINTDNTGVNTTTTIAGGAGNTTAMTIGATTQVTAHAHSDNALRSLYAAHSPTDIYGLYDGYAAHNNYTNSITVGITDAYALIIEDPTAFAAFTSSHPRATYILADDFISTTKPSKDLENAITVLMNQGETANEAYASAMAYLLSKYNTGLGLYNSKVGADGATTFKKKKTNREVITPAVPASGSTPAVPEKAKFVKKDC